MTDAPVVEIMCSGRWRIAALASLAVLVAGCTPSPSKVHEPAPTSRYRLHLPGIEHLVITENGIGSPSEPGSDSACEDFSLDEAQVRRFIRQAEGVSQRDYMHTLEWSPCHARGRIRLADGRDGTWTVRQFGTGSILFDDGSEIFLYCPSCDSSPFQR